MPLTDRNKNQSQSIEDLIAQLDSPVVHNGSVASSASGLTNGYSNETNSESRKFLKGKRTNGIGNSNSPNAGSPSFVKTNSFGQNSEPILHKNIIISKKYTKHMKSLKERGSIKKGGAGGKHTWGAPGCELEADYLDAKDPNYDSEEENVVMVCVENNETAKSNPSLNDDSNESLKELHLNSLESEIKLIILEYFHNGDTIEVMDQLKSYNFSKIKPHLIAYLVQIALENNNTCKELMSRLLRDLNVGLFSEKDFVAGFDLLLNNLNDITLDNPDAPEKTGTFIARAIADKVISKRYLERFYETDCTNLPDIENDLVKKVVESARLLTNMSNHLFQLSHIWGNKGGFLPVKELSDKINELIQELYDSGDIDEAIRCLKELNVPHFHHEFVYEALDFALQKGEDNVIQLITELLCRLCKAVIVTHDQLKMGFIRVFDLIPDINLDVPNVNQLMDKILNECNSKGFVTNDIIDLAPNRSRKRFVSEGDGGRFKENGH